MKYEVIDREGKGGGLIVGEGTKIARNVSIDISGNVKIGENCLISEGAVILTHEHDMADFMNKSKIKAFDLEIGDNVFIGIHAIIVGVRSIGKNTIVGAGAVVLTDVVQNDCIFAGNPARVI